MVGQEIIRDLAYFSSQELLEELEARRIHPVTGEHLPQKPEEFIDDIWKAFDNQNRPEFAILLEKALEILKDKDLPPQYRHHDTAP